MEFSLYINQKAAVAWELSINEATLFSYLINGGNAWMRFLPDEPDFRNVANAKLVKELPLICKHEGTARRHMAVLENRGLIERRVVSNRSYFKITEKGFLWKSDTFSGPNESVRPAPKAKRNGLAKPNESVCPRPNESVRQSDKPTSSDKPISDQDLPEPAEQPPEPVKKLEPKSNATWTAYADAYQKRYGAEPKRNQTINAQLCKFVDRLGAEDAPEVAAHFLTNNKRWYVEKRHAIGTMLVDAEALHNEWQTGNRVTSAQAQQLDRKQNNLTVLDEVIAKRKAEGKM